jgi:hypothetical protein
MQYFLLKFNKTCKTEGLEFAFPSRRRANVGGGRAQSPVAPLRELEANGGVFARAWDSDCRSNRPAVPSAVPWRAINDYPRCPLVNNTFDFGSPAAWWIDTLLVNAFVDGYDVARLRQIGCALEGSQRFLTGAESSMSP